MLKTYFIIAFALLTLPALLIAAEWHTGEGVIELSPTTTVDDARQMAWNRARQEALSHAGVEVVGATAGKLQELSAGGKSEVYDHFSRFIQTFTRGRITEEKILFDAVETQVIPGTNQIRAVYRVTLSALIEPDTTAPDPAFVINLKLNSDNFREGETISLQLEATQDCYITVFNLYALDSLRIWFPNDVAAENQLRRGDKMNVPPPGAVWDLPLHLLPGKTMDVESVLVVATKEAVPFPEWEGSVVGGAVAMDRALTTLSGWLAKMPSDQRTETTATYTIIK